MRATCRSREDGLIQPRQLPGGWSLAETVRIDSPNPNSTHFRSSGPHRILSPVLLRWIPSEENVN